MKSVKFDLNYKIIVPPLQKAFKELTKDEVEHYFTWYISKIPERIHSLFD